MFDCFLAQMLVLILMFVCSARIFFLKHSRVDSFAVFSTIALFISLCILFCFGFSFFNLCVFLLALLVYFVNFRAVIRLRARLIIDGYSAVFIIFSILSLILTVALGAAIVLTRPVRYTAKDFGVTKSAYTLTGTTRDLRIRESFFTGGRFAGDLFVYEPVVHDEISAQVYADNPVLIFAPGIRAAVVNYEPYFMILAQKGFTVLAADFFTGDTTLLSSEVRNPVAKRIVESKFFRRFAAIHYENMRPDEFSLVLDAEKRLFTKKYSALTKLALEMFGDDTEVFYIVDGVDFDSIYAVIDEFNTEPYSNAKGFFSMNRVSEYETSGYGFIEQTDVLLAREKGIERENKFFIARYVAGKTIQAITEQK